MPPKMRLFLALGTMNSVYNVDVRNVDPKNGVQQFKVSVGPVPDLVEHVATFTVQWRPSVWAVYRYVKAQRIQAAKQALEEKKRTQEAVLAQKMQSRAWNAVREEPEQEPEPEEDEELAPPTTATATAGKRMRDDPPLPSLPRELPPIPDLPPTPREATSGQDPTQIQSSETRSGPSDPSELPAEKTSEETNKSPSPATPPLANKSPATEADPTTAGSSSPSQDATSPRLLGLSAPACHVEPTPTSSE